MNECAYLFVNMSKKNFYTRLTKPERVCEWFFFLFLYVTLLNWNYFYVFQGIKFLSFEKNFQKMLITMSELLMSKYISALLSHTTVFNSLNKLVNDSSKREHKNTQKNIFLFSLQAAAIATCLSSFIFSPFFGIKRNRDIHWDYRPASETAFLLITHSLWEWRGHKKIIMDEFLSITFQGFMEWTKLAIDTSKRETSRERKGLFQLQC